MSIAHLLWHLQLESQWDPLMGSPGLGANGSLHFVHATLGIGLHGHLGLAEDAEDVEDVNL